MRLQTVRSASVIKEDHTLIRFTFGRREEGITGFVAQVRTINVMALGGANPAFLRQYHRNRIGRHQLGLAEGSRLGTGNHRRTTFIAILLRIGSEFFLNQSFHTTFRTQSFLEHVALFLQLILFATDLHFFELGQMTKL